MPPLATVVRVGSAIHGGRYSAQPRTSSHSFLHTHIPNIDTHTTLHKMSSSLPSTGESTQEYLAYAYGTGVHAHGYDDSDQSQGQAPMPMSSGAEVESSVVSAVFYSGEAEGERQGQSQNSVEMEMEMSVEPSFIPPTFPESPEESSSPGTAFLDPASQPSQPSQPPSVPPAAAFTQSLAHVDLAALAQRTASVSPTKPAPTKPGASLPTFSQFAAGGVIPNFPAAPSTTAVSEEDESSQQGVQLVAGAFFAPEPFKPPPSTPPLPLKSKSTSKLHIRSPPPDHGLAPIAGPSRPRAAPPPNASPSQDVIPPTPSPLRSPTPRSPSPARRPPSPPRRRPLTPRLPPANRPLLSLTPEERAAVIARHNFLPRKTSPKPPHVPPSRESSFGRMSPETTARFKAREGLDAYPGERRRATPEDEKRRVRRRKEERAASAAGREGSPPGRGPNPRGRGATRGGRGRGREGSEPVLSSAGSKEKTTTRGKGKAKAQQQEDSIPEVPSSDERAQSAPPESPTYPHPPPRSSDPASTNPDSSHPSTTTSELVRRSFAGIAFPAPLPLPVPVRQETSASDFDLGMGMGSLPGPHNPTPSVSDPSQPSYLHPRPSTVILVSASSSHADDSALPRAETDLSAFAEDLNSKHVEPASSTPANTKGSKGSKSTTTDKVSSGTKSGDTKATPGSQVWSDSLRGANTTGSADVSGEMADMSYASSVNLLANLCADISGSRVEESAPLLAPAVNMAALVDYASGAATSQESHVDIAPPSVPSPDKRRRDDESGDGMGDEGEEGDGPSPTKKKKIVITKTYVSPKKRGRREEMIYEEEGERVESAGPLRRGVKKAVVEVEKHLSAGPSKPSKRKRAQEDEPDDVASASNKRPKTGNITVRRTRKSVVEKGGNEVEEPEPEPAPAKKTKGKGKERAVVERENVQPEPAVPKWKRIKAGNIIVRRTLDDQAEEQELESELHKKTKGKGRAKEVLPDESPPEPDAASSARRPHLTRGQPSEHTTPPAALAHPIRRVSRVFAYWRGDSCYYPGTIHSRCTAKKDAGKYMVHFDDGSQGTVVLHGLRAAVLREKDVVQSTVASERAGATGLVEEGSFDVVPRTGQVRVKWKGEGEPVRVDVATLRISQKCITEGWGDRMVTDEQIECEVGVKLEETVSGVKRTRGSVGVSRASVSESPAAGTDRLASRLPHPRSNYFVGHGFIISTKDAKSKESLQHAVLHAGGEVAEDFSEYWDISARGVVWRGKPVHAVWLVAPEPSTTDKWLTALALGVPCLSTRWVEDAIGGETDWQAYLLAAGHSTYLGAYCSQRVDPRWSDGSDESRAVLESMLDNPPVARPLTGVKMLCVLDKDAVLLNVVPKLLWAMGAQAVEILPARRAAERLDKHAFDYVFLPDDDEEVYKPFVTSKGGTSVNFLWVKQCLIMGRRLAVE